MNLYGYIIIKVHRGYIRVHLLVYTLWDWHCENTGCFIALKNPLCSTYSVLVVVQLLSWVQLFATPWTSALQDSLSLTISLSLLKLMFVESVIPSNHLILCCHLLLLPSARVFSNESASVAKVLELQLQHQSLPMNIQDWFPLRLTGLISLLSKGFSRVFSSTIVWISINSLALSILYGPTLTSVDDYWKKPQLWLYRPLSTKWCLCFLIGCLGLL